MKSDSIITAVLSGVAGLFLVAAVAGMVLQDRTAPVISLEGKNTLTYTEGDSYGELLKGMKAEDNKDGDVTESIRVSNIYVTSTNRAMVIYVAKDHANNVGKLKREVRYQEAASVTDTIEDTEENSPEEAQESAATNTTPAQNHAGAASQAQNTQGQTAAQNGPRIIMLQTEATLKIGETFNIYRYIERAVDENGNDISRSMHVDGTYDMTRAGVYELKLYVINGAGVRSQTETFTLTVTE